jgi:hypothetical protein
MTRIPELEQELVAAAARLQSPRQVLRRAAAVVVLVVLAVVAATEKDRADRGRQPTGTPPSQHAAKGGIDAQAGVRLSLEGRQLTVGLLSWTPNEIRDRVVGARIRATCGVTLAQVGPEGDPRNGREERTRLWPAGRDTLRFRFARDISKIARWCRVEDPAVGHVAFVKFGSAPVRPLSATQTIEVTEEGVPFSFRVPAGWERFSSVSTDKSAGGPISFNQSVVGPQGAEAIIYWTSFPDGDYADPCARLLSPPVGSAAADLAAAVSTAPGTELVTGPSNVTLGGRPAKHVALTVRENVGCDPGFFYSWRDVNGGALWPTTGVGDTIRVWIVDVDATRLFIEAGATKQAVGDLEREVQQIVESISFE